MIDHWHAKTGATDLCSEVIAWLLKRANACADLRAVYAKPKDEVGLAYKLRQLAAHTKAAVGVNDLRKIKRRRSSGHA